VGEKSGGRPPVQIIAKNQVYGDTKANKNRVRLASATSLL
jgi:hypothetical protein